MSEADNDKTVVFSRAELMDVLEELILCAGIGEKASSDMIVRARVLYGCAGLGMDLVGDSV